MEKNVVALVIVVVVSSVLITAGVVAFYALAGSSTNDEVFEGKECGTIYDREGSTNIVFLSDEANAKRYADYLLSIQPIATNQNAFNFFYVDSDIAEEECEIYKGVALLCYSKDVVREASICPNDYIVVLKEMPRSIRSSAFSNVMSINTAHSMSVFAHEFGHAFANLAEEYLTEARIPRGSQNCQEECSGFGGIEDGCFEGCTDNGHVRSIDAGVMKTLSSSEYGTFNEYLIRERIDEENLKDGESRITGQITSDELRAIYGQGETIETCRNQALNYIEVDFSPVGTEFVSSELGTGCVGSLGFGPNELRLQIGGITVSEYTNIEKIFTHDGGHVFEGKEELDGAIYENREQPDSDRKHIILKYPLAKEDFRDGGGQEGEPTDPVTLLLRSPIDPDSYRPVELPTEVDTSEDAGVSKIKPSGRPRIVEEDGQMYEEREIELPSVEMPRASPAPKLPSLKDVLNLYDIARKNIGDVAEKTISPGDDVVSPPPKTDESLEPEQPSAENSERKKYECDRFRLVIAESELQVDMSEIQVDSSISGQAANINSEQIETNSRLFVFADCKKTLELTPVVVAREYDREDVLADRVEDRELEDYVNRPDEEGIPPVIEFEEDIDSFESEVFAQPREEVAYIYRTSGITAARVDSAILQNDFYRVEEYAVSAVAQDESLFAIEAFQNILSAGFMTPLTGLAISEPAQIDALVRTIALFWMGVAIGLVFVLSLRNRLFPKFK